MRHYAALRLRLLRAFNDEPDFDLAALAARLPARPPAAYAGPT